MHRTLEALDLPERQGGRRQIEHPIPSGCICAAGRLSRGRGDVRREDGKEHSAVQKLLRVNALRNDPLPYAWKDLPSVEFLHAREAPDSWFLPYLTGHLRLPLTTRHPIHLDVLMNASPSGPSRGLSAGTVNNWVVGQHGARVKGVLADPELAGGSLPSRSLIFPTGTPSSIRMCRAGWTGRVCRGKD